MHFVFTPFHKSIVSERFSRFKREQRRKLRTVLHRTRGFFRPEYSVTLTVQHTPPIKPLFLFHTAKFSQRRSLSRASVCSLVARPTELLVGFAWIMISVTWWGQPRPGRSPASRGSILGRGGGGTHLFECSRHSDLSSQGTKSTRFPSMGDIQPHCQCLTNSIFQNTANRVFLWCLKVTIDVDVCTTSVCFVQGVDRGDSWDSASRIFYQFCHLSDSTCVQPLVHTNIFPLYLEESTLWGTQLTAASVSHHG